MSEHMSPIPSRIYNAAIGGHVCGAVDIIDDTLGLKQSSINEDVAPMPYNDGNPNGMGRIILKKTDNFKNVVEAQSGNTIFIIKYDFTLTGNVTVPANCVLKFEGGSISGAYTITGQNTGIQAELTAIFRNDVLFGGTWDLKKIYPDWFTSSNAYDDDKFTSAEKLSVTGTYCISLSPSKEYNISTPVTIESSLVSDSKECARINMVTVNARIKGEHRHGEIRGIRFVGLSASFTTDTDQICIEILRGYKTIIRDCFFDYFYIAVKIGGTDISFIDNLFASNYYGVAFYRETQFTSCVTFERDYFNGTRNPVNDSVYPGTNESNNPYGTTRKVVFNNCIFESATKALHFGNNSVMTISNCWFEDVTNDSVINTSPVLINNRFESNGSSITISSSSGRSTTIISGAEVKAGKIGFSNIPANGAERSTLSIKEGVSSGLHMLLQERSQFDKDLSIVCSELQSNTPYKKTPNIISNLMVNDDGTDITLYSYSSNLNPTISYNSNGYYEISLGILINSPVAIVSDNSSNVDYRPTTSFKLSMDISGGKRIHQANTLYVKFVDGSGNSVRPESFNIIIIHGYEVGPYIP